MGFPVPLREWLKSSPVRDFAGDVLLSKPSKERGIFKVEALEKFVLDPGVGARTLWGALCLELWHRRFIDGSDS
jgi:asparagine synthase (glutamine-hydrolysing)